LRSDTHCKCSKSIAYVTRPADIEYSQRITERSSNNIYIHILNYKADIFTKQVYVEKVYLTFGLKPMMRKLEKDNGLEMLEISVLFSYRKLSNYWKYVIADIIWVFDRVSW